MAWREETQLSSPPLEPGRLAVGLRRMSLRRHVGARQRGRHLSTAAAAAAAAAATAAARTRVTVVGPASRTDTRLARVLSVCVGCVLCLALGDVVSKMHHLDVTGPRGGPFDGEGFPLPRQTLGRCQ